MTKSRTVHVLPSKSGWRVRKSSAARALRIFTSEQEAISYACALGEREQTDLFIHKVDGRIGERRQFTPHYPAST